MPLVPCSHVARALAVAQDDRLDPQALQPLLSEPQPEVDILTMAKTRVETTKRS
jgi:hypothetical protein